MVDPTSEQSAASTPALKKALARSIELGVWAESRWPIQFRDMKVDRFAAAAYSIVRSHRAAIIVLLQLDQRTSAFALFRPVLEASITGDWFRFVADANRLETAFERGALPTTHTMTADLRKVQSPQFSSIRAALWEPASDFAHGGLRQLTNWIKDGEIGPIHPEDEVCELLSLTDVLFLLACVNMAELAAMPTVDILKRTHAELEHYRTAKLQYQTSGGFTSFRGRKDLL